ncbi:MAG: hypothetical protein ABF504_04190 [Komagataeibacter saccharivorans]|uniref:hypothetical protein n=1 Tax=Komagataeibacter saccharivorans TaxID=265959 RepID=UPI0039E9C887
MPVLSGHDQPEWQMAKPVDNRHERIRPGHGQCAAGQKIHLHVDNQQGIGCGYDRHGWSLRFCLPHIMPDPFHSAIPHG